MEIYRCETYRRSCGEDTDFMCERLYKLCKYLERTRFFVSGNMTKHALKSVRSLLCQVQASLAPRISDAERYEAYIVSR